jgi:hypothetical protein
MRARIRACAELAAIPAVFLLAALVISGIIFALPRPVATAYFGIPYGAVWSNLVASVLCVGFVFFRLRARMIAQHAAHLAQERCHHVEKMALAEDHHQEALALAADQHEKVLAAIAAVPAAPPVVVVAASE